MTKQQTQTFHGFDRPDVEVLVDDTWWPGELRQWTQADDGTWQGNVTYSIDGARHSATFPPSRSARTPSIGPTAAGPLTNLPDSLTPKRRRPRLSLDSLGDSERDAHADQREPRRPPHGAAGAPVPSTANYDRARVGLDRHAVHTVSAFLSGGA